MEVAYHTVSGTRASGRFTQPSRVTTLSKLDFPGSGALGAAHEWQRPVKQRSQLIPPSCNCIWPASEFQDFLRRGLQLCPHRHYAFMATQVPPPFLTKPLTWIDNLSNCAGLTGSHLEGSQPARHD